MNSRHQIRPNSGIDNNVIKSVSSAFAIGSTTLRFSCGLEELTAKKNRYFGWNGNAHTYLFVRSVCQSQMVTFSCDTQHCLASFPFPFPFGILYFPLCRYAFVSSLVIRIAWHSITLWYHHVHVRTLSTLTYLCYSVFAVKTVERFVECLISIFDGSESFAFTSIPLPPPYIQSNNVKYLNCCQA